MQENNKYFIFPIFLDDDTNSSASKICCCVGPMCNANYNVHLVKSTNSTWSLVLLACLVTLIALLFLISKFWTMSTVKNNSKTTLNKDVLVSTNQEKLLFPLLPSNTVNMNGYVIEEILHSGRFATNYTLTGNVQQLQLWFTFWTVFVHKMANFILQKKSWHWSYSRNIEARW